MTTRRPLLKQRALDFHPLDDRANAADHRAFVRCLRHGSVGRNPERLALRHARLVFELAKLRGAHLEVSIAKGHSGARPVGERDFEHDVAIRAFLIIRIRVLSLFVDHGSRANAETITRIRHWRRPRAEFAVRPVAAIPTNGEQTLGRMRPHAVLKARRVPVMPGFVVVGADLFCLGLRRGDRRFLQREVRRLQVTL